MIPPQQKCLSEKRRTLVELKNQTECLALPWLRVKGLALSLLSGSLPVSAASCLLTSTVVRLKLDLSILLCQVFDESLVPELDGHLHFV